MENLLHHQLRYETGENTALLSAGFAVLALAPLATIDVAAAPGCSTTPLFLAVNRWWCSGTELVSSRWSTATVSTEQASIGTGPKTHMSSVVAK